MKDRFIKLRQLLVIKVLISTNLTGILLANLIGGLKILNSQSSINTSNPSVQSYIKLRNTILKLEILMMIMGLQFNH